MCFIFKLLKIDRFTIIIKIDKGVWYMSRKDKVLVIYDKCDDLIGIVVFNKITK